MNTPHVSFVFFGILALGSGVSALTWGNFEWAVWDIADREVGGVSSDTAIDYTIHEVNSLEGAKKRRVSPDSVYVKRVNDFEQLSSRIDELTALMSEVISKLEKMETIYADHIKDSWPEPHGTQTTGSEDNPLAQTPGQILEELTKETDYAIDYNTMEEEFWFEEQDPYWSVSMSGALEEALMDVQTTYPAIATGIVNVDCKSTLCRVDLESVEGEEETAIKLMFMERFREDFSSLYVMKQPNRQGLVRSTYYLIGKNYVESETK